MYFGDSGITNQMMHLTHKQKICIIVLNWNGKEDTLECLQSLSELSYSNYQVVVIGNGSSDGSIAAINAQFPSIDIIATGKSLGFSGDNNASIKGVLNNNFDYIFLLNIDTIVNNQLLIAFIEATES